MDEDERFDIHEDITSDQLEFMAPEYYDGIITTKTDMWQLGQLFYQMIFGEPPI